MKIKKGAIVKILDNLWMDDLGIGVVVPSTRESREYAQYRVFDIEDKEYYHFYEEDLEVLGQVTQLEKLIWEIK